MKPLSSADCRVPIEVESGDPLVALQSVDPHIDNRQFNRHSAIDNRQ